MRLKRRILSIIITIIFLLSFSVVFAMAYSDTTISTANSTLKMYGYLDFLEGPNVIKDKIWYDANIYGTYDMTGIMTNASYGDDNCCYVIPGTNKHSLSKQFMYKGKLSVSSGSSGVYIGYGGSNGKMIMNLMGKKYTFMAY